MSEFIPIAVFHQQMPDNEIRQARTLFEVIVSRHGATWSKFRPCEEIADLLKRTVLQSQTHQAGDPNLLCDVIPAVEEGEALAHEVCSSSEADGSVRRS